jgi:hypothetical protein
LGAGGGGGGAGAVGSNVSIHADVKYGGAGLANSITGSSVYYAGGGGGGDNGGGTPSGLGTGGVGGGGTGGYGGGGSTAGTANTGGGGGGGSSVGGGSTGGSGVCIISVPQGIGVTFSGGVTATSANNGTSKVYTITATTSGSETVTFS